jgi:hypothetical protein
MSMAATSGLAGLAPMGLGAMCAGSTPTPNSMPQFATHALGCSPAPGPACPGGTCVEAAAHLCIYQAGLLPCPTTTYTKQTIVYNAIQNTFTCTQCQCGITGQPFCNPTVTLYQDQTCTSVLGTDVLDGISCLHVAVTGQSMKITDVGTVMGGTCSVMGGGVLGGSAAPTSPVTVCCKN